MSPTEKITPGLRREELFTYIQYFLKRPNLPNNKFFIFAHYRAGTNLLRDLLNSHPEIYCDEEIFNPFMLPRPRKVLFPYLYMKSKSMKVNIDMYGCNLKLDQLSKILIYSIHGDPEKFIFNLCEKGWKIIYLTRHNILRQAISNQAAYSRQQWIATRDNPIGDSKIHIDCGQLLNEMRWISDTSGKEENIFRKLPHIKLTYENDLFNEEHHQDTLNRIFDYLGLPPVPVKTDMMRTSCNKLSDFIQNYEELANIIHTSEYARYLEEE